MSGNTSGKRVAARLAPLAAVGAAASLALGVGCCSSLSAASLAARAPQVEVAAAGPVAVRAIERPDGPSRFHAGGIEFDVDRNEFGRELAHLLGDTLEGAGVSVAAGDREIAVGVDYVDFLFQGPCILDFHVVLGDAPPFGMQARGDSMNFAYACRQALEDAVRGILADRRTRDYLGGAVP